MREFRVLGYLSESIFPGEERQSASKVSKYKHIAKSKQAASISQAYRRNLDFDASGPGRAAIWAILALSRARHALEMALIFFIYPVRGLTEHRISNRGSVVPTLGKSIPVLEPFDP